MRLKLYLRGLGIGMVVTAILMGIALDGKEPMSDEDIRARAAQLGMVEDTTLANLLGNFNMENSGDEEGKEEADTLGVDKGDVAAPEETGEGFSGPGEETGEGFGGPGEETGEGFGGPGEETGEGFDESEEEVGEGYYVPEETEDNSEALDEREEDLGSVMIVIRRGDSSTSVSRSLEEAGLVDDARAYDSFLSSRGYDKKIRSGSFQIPRGSTDEEIAKIITSGT